MQDAPGGNFLNSWTDPFFTFFSSVKIDGILNAPRSVVRRRYRPLSDAVCLKKRRSYAGQNEDAQSKVERPAAINHL